jgi:hypothetical protein
VQGTHESALREELFRLRPRRHRGGDGARDVVVDLVVLLLAQAGRKPDLEDEELADELGRIEVIGQTRAVGFKRRPSYVAPKLISKSMA